MTEDSDSCSATDHADEALELERLLADLGEGEVEGSYGGVPLDLFCVMPQGGSQASFADPVPGMYVSAHFPRSLMADLLLETGTSSECTIEDPLAAFSWSGTSKDYVESCLRGPLLEWLVTACKTQVIEIRDERLRSGPLPNNPTEAVVVIAGICRVITEHFDNWSIPVPSFDDD